jgi:hypothetical protein
MTPADLQPYGTLVSSIGIPGLLVLWLMRVWIPAIYQRHQDEMTRMLKEHRDDTRQRTITFSRTLTGIEKRHEKAMDSLAESVKAITVELREVRMDIARLASRSRHHDAPDGSGNFHRHQPGTAEQEQA